MSELADLASERALLAGIYQHAPRIWSDIEDLCSPDLFTLTANNALYRCYRHIFEQDQQAKLDQALIDAAATTLNYYAMFDKPDERKHLAAIFRMPVEAGSMRKLAGRLRKLQLSREILARVNQAEHSLMKVTGDESLAEIVSKAESPIFDYTSTLSVLQGGGEGVVAVGNNIEDYVEHLINNPVQMVGIPTGFKQFDNVIGGGLQAGFLDIVAARAGEGKSTLGSQIGLSIACRDIHVLNCDTEMDLEMLQRRTLACLAGVKVERIKTGQLNDEEKYLVRKAAKHVASLPYSYRCIRGQSMESIMSNVRHWLFRTVGLQANGKANPCVLIYDYIKLMGGASANKNLAEHQAIGNMVTTLKDFVGHYGVSCLAFAQMNRDSFGYKDARAVAQSDRILWFGTSVSLFYQKTPEEAAEEEGDNPLNTHLMIPIKTRDGKGLFPGDYINFQAQLDRSRFREGPTRFQMKKGISDKGFDTTQLPENIEFGNNEQSDEGTTGGTD